jgi:hypothetical protein
MSVTNYHHIYELQMHTIRKLFLLSFSLSHRSQEQFVYVSKKTHCLLSDPCWLPSMAPHATQWYWCATTWPPRRLSAASEMCTHVTITRLVFTCADHAFTTADADRRKQTIKQQEQVLKCMAFLAAETFWPALLLPKESRLIKLPCLVFSQVSTKCQSSLI